MATVTDDPGRARRSSAAGENVVLIVPPEAETFGRPVARSEGGGRVAVMVGDSGDTEVREAAQAMAAELFGRTRPLKGT